MTFPIIPSFRNEHAPRPPALYVDVDPDGERIDPTLAVGDATVLMTMRDLAVKEGIGGFITQDLDNRIKLATGQELPKSVSKEVYQGVDPLILKGEEARQLRGKYDAAVNHTGRTLLGWYQRRQLKKLGGHMLKQNQIPDLNAVDDEYKDLIAKSKKDRSDVRFA